MARATKRLSGHTVTGARAPGTLIWPFPSCARFSAGLQRPWVLGSWRWTGSSDREDMARAGPWQVLLRWGPPWVTEYAIQRERECEFYSEEDIGRGRRRGGGRGGRRREEMKEENTEIEMRQR